MTNPLPHSPRPASLFEREREVVPVIRGLEKTEAHEALHLPLFCRILTVEFQSALTSQVGVATLRLELSPLAAAHLRMHLFFKNVTDFTLGSLPAEGLTCACFGIEDARHLGRNKINWEVADFKSDALRFYAEEAEIVSVTMT